MQVYLFTAGVETAELVSLEARIKAMLPSLQRVAKLDDLGDKTASGTTAVDEQTYVIFPILNQPSSLERIVGIAERYRGGHFFIFVSAEISASDYKRLTRSGRADWASIERAPVEIREIIHRGRRTQRQPEPASEQRPAIAAFVPSAGGVGNATIAIEAAIQLKSAKQTRDKRICLLDLDLQGSHVCDYLDIEPRFQFEEIAADPGRLDPQLFDLFVSRHASGLDVLAAPRSKSAGIDVDLAALDELFKIIAQRYDILLLDFPAVWRPWTSQVLSACDLCLVTGLNTVAGLRLVAETIKAVRGLDRVPPQVSVVLNRCEANLFGKIARSQHFKRIIGSEAVVYVPDDLPAASHSVNTGVPLSLMQGSNRISKSVRPLTQLLTALKPVAAFPSHGATALTSKGDA